MIRNHPNAVPSAKLGQSAATARRVSDDDCHRSQAAILMESDGATIGTLMASASVNQARWPGTAVPGADTVIASSVAAWRFTASTSGAHRGLVPNIDRFRRLVSPRTRDLFNDL